MRNIWRATATSASSRFRRRLCGAWLRDNSPLAISAGVVALLALALTACSSGPGASVSTTQPAATGTAMGTVAPTPQITPTTSAGYPVSVYFSRHPDSDNNPALVFVAHRVSPTLGVATYAIKQLIAGPTASEAQQGYYTPLTSSITGTSNCGGADFKISLDMKGATPQTGTATLQFCRTTQLAGDLTGGRITAEITKTLLQFSNIHTVVILTVDGGCFDDLSGQNLCLK